MFCFCYVCHGSSQISELSRWEPHVCIVAVVWLGLPQTPQTCAWDSLGQCRHLGCGVRREIFVPVDKRSWLGSSVGIRDLPWKCMSHSTDRLQIFIDLRLSSWLLRIHIIKVMGDWRSCAHVCPSTLSGECPPQRNKAAVLVQLLAN